jgi:hypothetical protein
VRTAASNAKLVFIDSSGNDEREWCPLGAKMKSARAVAEAQANYTAMATLFRLALLATLPLSAWSQAPLVEGAYVSIVPAGDADVDSVLEFQRGIEIVLCQSGVKPHLDATPGAQLKLSAQMMKAEYMTDRKAGEVLRVCELTEAAATLPDGSRIPLPDLAISSRSAIRGPNARRGATDTFFLACGANFARSALDALKDKVALKGSRCDEPTSSRTARSPANASRKKR